MKTSNKLLAVVAAIILIYLVIYDNGLQAEYLKGEFRSPFYQMEQLSFKDFNSVRNNSADKVGIQIKKGDKFQVWIKSRLKDKMAVTQQGKTLVLQMTKQNGTEIWGYDSGVIIICPQLDSLTTVTDAESSNRKADYKNAWYNTTTVIVGFNQQKMILNLKKVTGVSLAGNQIDDLEATVGNKTIGKASLNINASNRIKQATIQVPGKSELILSSPAIENFNYTISDSAKITLTGKALQLFKNH